MSGFPRRPLAILVCCAFAGTQVAHAAIDAAALPVPASGGGEAGLPGAIRVAAVELAQAAAEPPVRLRMERKFDILAPKPAAAPWPGMKAPPPAPESRDARPAFIVADHIEGRSDEVTEAEGKVEFRKIGSLLFADKLTYWPLEDEVEAVGNVRLLQNQDEISGPRMRLKISDQIGFFEEADYRIRREVATRFYRPGAGTLKTTTRALSASAPLMMNVSSAYGLDTPLPPRRPTEGQGHAERIDFEGDNQVSLTDATYSTCKADDEDWYLRGKSVHLDYDREVADVKDATLMFKDVPVFYAPVGSFSLNHQRKSGLLPATFSASTRNGLDLTLPYYWNLAPNYDATFYPREMSKRGFQLGAEARYLDFNYSGHSKLEYLPEDQVERRSRYAYSLVHHQNLGRGFSANINWNGVSDDTYWQDFSSRLLHTSQLQLPRQMVLGYSPGSWWSASMQLLRYQTLSPNAENPTARPYFIEPQLNFSGRLNNVYKTDFSIFGQYSRFTHPDQPEGGRIVVYPQLTLPYVSPALMILPKVGLHATQYAMDRVANPGDPTSLSRVVPTFSIDSTLFFERDTSLFGSSFVQTLEPRLYYVYIPYRNQDRLPVFDSGIADFNFAQIFNENRYTGFDRINDANQLTAAVTTRFLDAGTGAERFKAMIGQRYYFKEQRVTIPGETARADDFSNLLAGFTGLVLPKTYVDAAWEYNYHKSQNERYSVGARYQPEPAKVLSASYRFTRDAVGVGQIEQFDIAGQWPLSRRWYAVGRYNYSVRDKQLLEVIGGLEYNAGCWAGRFVVQRLDALTGSANTTFFFQLELNDFASIGSNPIQLLRRTIPGYGKINELPTTGSLLTTE